MDAQIATNPVNPTVGSLFAGIGGFDLGFEQVGFRTEWQVEIADIPRAVLADHFPHAKQFTDVRTCLPELWHTDVIIGGFPCQDVSMAGKRRGGGSFSWPDWESSPQSSLWLTPEQFAAWQARVARGGKNPTVLCLQASRQAVSTERARILSLSPADGVRWLSGAERLQMMGFAKDWMQPTLQRLGLPETPSVRRLRAGSRKS